MPAVSVAGIILAAGFSRRLGRPKQTVEIGGETLLRRAVRVAAEAGLGPLFVVSAAHRALEAGLLGAPCSVVLNTEPEEGMASSIRAGVLAAQAVSGIVGTVMMTCDQVQTGAHHLRALSSERDRMCGSAYAGRVGVPAYFPRAMFEELLRLRGEAGARELLSCAASISAEELSLDVDTEADLTRARELLEDLPRD